jgi:hypothetical protein
VGNRLMTVLLTLDNELPTDLDRLAALRSECFAGRGFHPRLRLRPPARGSVYSALMPAHLTTLAHFSDSAAT